MSRLLLYYLLPIVLPSLAYVAWTLLARHRAEAGEPPLLLKDGPWFRLLLAGFFLMLIGLGILTMTGSMSPEGTYRAPYAEDGKIIPGGMQPPLNK